MVIEATVCAHSEYVYILHDICIAAPVVAKSHWHFAVAVRPILWLLLPTTPSPVSFGCWGGGGCPCLNPGGDSSLRATILLHCRDCWAIHTGYALGNVYITGSCSLLECMAYNLRLYLPVNLIIPLYSQNVCILLLMIGCKHHEMRCVYTQVTLAQNHEFCQ